jgi:4-amino-4-deoxy-L-arabinose transferase-like glycosyltransferase
MLSSLSKIDNWSAIYAEDSEGYLLVARHFMGEDIQPQDTPRMRYRLFSSVIPFLASVLGRIIGVEYAFFILNLLLWNVTALLFYEFLKLVLDDSVAAFAGAVILTTSLPFIEWGLPIMVDMGGYFFACIIPLLYLKVKEKGAPTKIVFGLCIGIAILTKPILIILLIFVTSCFLSEKKIGSAVSVVVTACFLVVMMYGFYNLTLQDFTAFGMPRHRGLVYLFSAAFFCFHWGWIFFLRGWKSEDKHRGLYLCYLLSFLVPYLLFVHNPRLFFLAYPGVIPLIAKGIRKSCANFQNQYQMIALTLAGYVLTSNLLTALHLYVMRILKIRDWEGLVNFLTQKIA